MDTIKRSIFWLIFLSIVVYLVYLFSNWAIIVNETFLDKNKLIFGIYLFVFLYYLVFYSIKPMYVKKHKLWNTLIWLFIITSSQSLLLNSWNDWIYFADMFTVIWIFLTAIWPTNVLISNKLKKAKQDKKMEIIEA